MIGVAVLVGYLLGAIPTGVIVARLWGGNDVLATGSRHTGGTNVARACGSPWPGVLTGVLDLALGAAAVLVGRALGGGSMWSAALAGAAAVVGHNWSVYIHFAGGIGLATLTGALLALDPLAALIALLILVPAWVGTRRALRHDARGTVVTLAFVVPILLLSGRPLPVVAGTGLGVLAAIARSLGDWHRRYSTGEGVLHQFRLQRTHEGEGG